jgi:alpha-galactosidase
MIEVTDGVFRLSTKTTSYWFRTTIHDHLEHLHYGIRLESDQSVATLGVKRTAEIGTSIAYDESDPLYGLDNLCLEWSGIGMGDYRESPGEVLGGHGSYSSDFTYRNHHISAGPMVCTDLPGGYGDDEDASTLTINMVDEAAALLLTLEYTVFPSVDVIARRATLHNTGDTPVAIRKLASLMVDLPNRDFRLLTLHGGWIKEAHLEDRSLPYGMTVISSTTGASSNRHNPGFLLAQSTTDETHGRAYGFNLIYSGNHRETIERSDHDLVRITLGINPHCFEWVLDPGQPFETPQAVMTFSSMGLGQVSRNFHDFINNSIVRGQWKNKPRPVIYNNWEATFFKFRADTLLKLARQAARLGMELFVLDDGWFSRRNSDKAGLGDYWVNRRKFPSGLPHFADSVRSLGMGFGIWVEPEMVNEDSDLFRAHPQWAITTPGRTAAKGRHQLVLDLTNPEVRDYIVDNVSTIIDQTRATYVKWDFNRPLSDAFSPLLTTPGEFFHRYILGLYDVLRRIFIPRPQVLFESCASGGNRFDLGMLCFSPQIWASDDTDPVERLAIQGGYSYLYPPSVMGAHVSEAPHQQTLRATPLTTRFNVAAFGCLGYEMDLKILTRVERAEIREEIEFYRQHREVFQYGRHYRTDRETGAKPNKVVWTMVSRDGVKALTGLFQTMAQASEGIDRLPVEGLCPRKRYRLQTRPQSLFIGRFGSLIKHIVPGVFKPDGLVISLAKRIYRMTDCVETYEGYGATFDDGILLNNQFMGSYYNPHTRLLGDFGSNLYLTSRIDDN